jgi:hypothetical protein
MTTPGILLVGELMVGMAHNVPDTSLKSRIHQASYDVILEAAEYLTERLTPALPDILTERYNNILELIQTEVTGNSA